MEGKYVPSRASTMGKGVDQQDIPDQEGDADGSTFGLGSNRNAEKYLTALHVFKGGKCETFFYSMLDHSEYKPGGFVLTFRGLGGGHRVTVEGRNLWNTYRYITQHRWAAIAEASDDMAADGEVFVKKISIEAMKDD